MPVTVDARTDGLKTAGATSLAWNHTVAAGLINGAIVGTGTTGAGTAQRISTFQWDAAGTPVPMNNLGFVLGPVVGNVYTEIWGVTASGGLTPGTKQVKITPAASCEITGGSISCQFVNQAAMWNPASPQTATGTVSGGGTPQPSVAVTSAVNELVIACVVDNEGATADTLVAGASQTTIHNDTIAAATHAGASSDKAGAASVTMSYTGVAATNWWAIIGGSLQFSAGAAGGFFARYYYDMPVGRPGV